MKINTKIPNKILLIVNEMFIRKIIQHNQLGFMPDFAGMVLYIQFNNFYKSHNWSETKIASSFQYMQNSL